MSDETPMLPDSLLPLLQGDGLEDRVGLTFQLLTVDEESWPHVALLSAGEVLAPDPGELRLALWVSSRTTANLTRTGQGVLAVVHDRAAHTVRLAAERKDDLAGPERRAVFFARVLEARRDEVPYAGLTGGITFDLADAPAVVARWRATISALRAHPGSPSPRR